MKKLIVIALIMIVIFGLLFSYNIATSIHVLDREIVEVYDDYLIVCDPENFRSSSIYRSPQRLFLNTLRKPANWEPGQNIRIYYSNHYLHKIERVDRVWYTNYNEPFDPAIRETVFWECAVPFLVIGAAGSITLAALHICKKKQPKSPATSAE
jgi:hypothetical protein